MRWDSLLALVPVCVSSCGLVLTVTVIAIFIRHSETPIVKVRISFVCVVITRPTDRPSSSVPMMQTRDLLLAQRHLVHF